MKCCTQCNIEKELKCFSVRKSAFDGHQHTCKDCNKANLKLHYQNNKAYYLDKKNRNQLIYQKEFVDYLKTQSCKDCGEKDIVTFEFDHKFDKSYNISSKFGRVPLKTLMSEIDKCDLVCANCHRKRTAIQFNWFKAKQ